LGSVLVTKGTLAGSRARSHAREKPSYAAVLVASAAGKNSKPATLKFTIALAAVTRPV
jgi:hypothetical protein